MTYEADIDAILLELITRLKEISDFNNRVYKAYWQTITESPTCLVTPMADDLQIKNVKPDFKHSPFSVDVSVFLRATGENVEADVDSLIAITGKVVDKVTAYASNVPKWNLAQPERVDYACWKTETHVFYISFVTVKIFKS